MKKPKTKDGKPKRKSLRDEPEFQELLKDLRSQTPEQQKRFAEYLDEQIDREGKDHGKDKQGNTEKE
jgi:hypothetical protein